MAKRNPMFECLEIKSLMSTLVAGIWVNRPAFMAQVADKVPYEIDTIGLGNPTIPGRPIGLLDVNITVTYLGVGNKPSSQYKQAEVLGVGDDITFGDIDLSHMGSGEYKVTIAAWDGSYTVKGEQVSTKTFDVIAPATHTPFFVVSI